MQNEDKKVNKSFFQNMKTELKKVIWPTGKQTVKSTAVTIVFVLLISAILIVLNLCFNGISNWWYETTGIIESEKPNVSVSGDRVSGENIITTVSGDVTTPVQSGEVSGETL